MKKITFTEVKNIFSKNPSCVVVHDWWDNETRIGKVVMDGRIVRIAENYVGDIVYNEDDKFYIKKDGCVVMKSDEDGDCTIRILSQES